jgi:hypothetical protein
MRSMRTYCGAAMVEFVVAGVFLLVPLYLVVQALGKFADVQHSTNTAARYAAWERTVWFDERSSRFHAHNQPNQKTTNQIRSETMVRVFNDRRSPLRYRDDDKNATSFARGLDPLWRDTNDTVFLAANPGADLTLSNSFRRPSNDWVGGTLSAIGSVSIPNVTGSMVPPVPTDTLAVGGRARTACPPTGKVWTSQGTPQF